MSVPTRRILDPIFGQPILRAENNGRALWTRVNALSQWQKGTGWQANLYGGVQTGDDWAAMFVPVSEMKVTDFNAALWSYYMTGTQTMGVNLVIWAHDPNDFSKRAEITQRGNVAGLGKAAKWNSHTLDKTVAQFFFYGEGTTGTGLTAGTLYTWVQFQADPLFSTWHIYRVSLEYGWEASGTFDHVWVVELKLNGMQIPIRPSVEEIISGSGDVYVNSNTSTDDTARRFETTPKILRDVIVIVKTKAQVFGDSANQTYPVATDGTFGITRIDISTLYFKHAVAGEDGTVHILGVEE